MSWYKNIFKSNKPNSADQRIISQLFFGNRITTDDPRDEEYADKGYQLSPTVFGIINNTATAASQVPWKIYKKNTDGTKTETRNPLLEKLLNRPNFRDTWPQFIQDAISWKMISGNTYVWGVNPDETSINNGKPQALWTLPSDRMQIWQSGPFQGISHYTLDFTGQRAGGKPIDATEMLHLSSFQPEYDLDGSFLFGQSPLRAAYRSLLTTNEAIVTSNSYIENQGPQSLLTAKHGPDTPSFDAEQARELKRQFRAQSQGSNNAGGVLITPMEFNILSTGMSAADLKLLEQYQVSKLDICNVYNYPSLLLGIGTGTYDNQREAKLTFYEDVVIPHLQELRDGLNRNFISKFGNDICIDYDLSGVHVLQERNLRQAEAVSQLQGIATLNEARAKLGLPKFSGPEGEQLLVTNRFDQNSNAKQSGHTRGSGGSEEASAKS